MSLLKAQQCCCQQNGLLLGCTQWQSICFGTATPNNMPVTCEFNASGARNVTYVWCCKEGGPEYLQTEFVGTMTMTATGHRLLNNPDPGHPCHNGLIGNGADLWSGGYGLKYSMSGSWVAQVVMRQYMLIQDPVTQECFGSSLCFEDTYTAAGTVTGCLLCGQCAYPRDPTQPCGCPFSGNCVYYRGWQVLLSGGGNLLGSRTYYGQCCTDRQKSGLPCYEPFDAQPCSASAQVQWRAGCEPANAPCPTEAQGGCFQLVNDSSMECCIMSVPLLSSVNFNQGCFVTEVASGSASVTFQ